MSLSPPPSPSLLATLPTKRQNSLRKSREAYPYPSLYPNLSSQLSTPSPHPKQTTHPHPKQTTRPHYSFGPPLPSSHTLQSTLPPSPFPPPPFSPPSWPWFHTLQSNPPPPPSPPPYRPGLHTLHHADDIYVGPSRRVLHVLNGLELQEGGGGG